MSKLDSIKATLKKMFSMVVVIFLAFIYVSINMGVYKDFGIKWVLVISTILIGLLIYFFSYRPTAKAMKDEESKPKRHQPTTSSDELLFFADALRSFIIDYKMLNKTNHLSNDEFLDAIMDCHNVRLRSWPLPPLRRLNRYQDDMDNAYEKWGTLCSLCPISLTYKEDERIKRAKDRYNKHRNDLLSFLEDFRQ